MPKQSKKKRHEAALKGWQTRRKNAKAQHKKKNKNQLTRAQGTQTSKAKPYRSTGKGGGQTAPAKSKAQRKKTAERKKVIPPSKPQRKALRPPKRAGAAKLSPQQRGAITRAKNKAAEFKRRSDAAKLGWQRRKHKKIESPNQEYLVTIQPRGGKKKKGRSPLPPKKRMPDFLAIYKKDAHPMTVVEFVILWIRKNMEKDQQWWIGVIYHAQETNRLIVARGPLTAKPQKVELR